MFHRAHVFFRQAIWKSKRTPTPPHTNTQTQTHTNIPANTHTNTPQEEKRRRQALREARIAFLEEEVPALVSRGAAMPALRRKMADVNKRLGEKFEISEAELQGTYDACRQLLDAGEVRGGWRAGGGGGRK